ncbi:MAG: hypothetical protein AAF215_03545 [Cyanobacteria bacterium P01_A01_bin.123]
MFATSAPATTCPIAQSVYRDVEGQGFELVFSESTNTVSKATATITHPDQAQLHRFDVTQASGYGSIFLSSIDAAGEPLGNGDSLEIYFFDEDFGDATPTFLGDETESPEYTFIAGLGSHDYYSRRGSVTPPLLGDIMWIHDRCQ